MLILDTCAISEAMSTERNQGFTNWLAKHRPDRLATTVITVIEVAHGLMCRPKGKRRERLIRSAEILFRSIHIYNQDKIGAWLAGQMIVLEEREGRILKLADASIAAITLKNDGQLVTRDGDFNGLAKHVKFKDFRVINPWSQLMANY